MVLSFNIKWLGQIAVLVGGLVYGYWNVIDRIERLETGYLESSEQIEELVSKHIEEEKIKYDKLEKELLWYLKELNLNPFSMFKRKKNSREAVFRGCKVSMPEIKGRACAEYRRHVVNKSLNNGVENGKTRR